MERVKLDNKRILFNLLPAHVAQHFLMSNPRNMVSLLPAPHPACSGRGPTWSDPPIMSLLKIAKHRGWVGPLCPRPGHRWGWALGSPWDWSWERA